MSIAIAPDIVLSEDEEALGITNNSPRIGYESVITATNVTSTEADPDHPLIDITTPVIYQYWRGTSDSQQSIQVDCGASTLVNYFALAGHNLGSTGATVVLQASSNGTDWTNASTPRILASNDAWIDEFANQTVRYYRLLITPVATTIPQIAVLHIGRVLRVPSRIYVGHAPSTLSRRTQVSTGRSETGQPLGRVKTGQYIETSAAFTNLTPSWLRTYFEPFMTAAEDGYFFWAWRPEAYPQEVIYGELTDDPQPTNASSNGRMSVSINIRGQR